MNLDTYANIYGISVHAIAEAQQHASFLIKLIVLKNKESVVPFLPPSLQELLKKSKKPHS